MAKYVDVYQRLVDAGAILDNHESDLYVECAPHIDNIVKASGWYCTRFTNEITGKLNWDIPFAYAPWWKKHGNSRNH